MYTQPTLATFYRLRMLPLQKGKFDVHNHVSWLFGLEIAMIENDIKSSIEPLGPPPVDCNHE